MSVSSISKRQSRILCFTFCFLSLTLQKYFQISITNCVLQNQKKNILHPNVDSQVKLLLDYSTKKLKPVHFPIKRNRILIKRNRILRENQVIG